MLAVGAELKSTFCVAHGRPAYLSAHLGDLDIRAGATRAFGADLELYLAMLGVRRRGRSPTTCIPSYRADAAGRASATPSSIGVQHHHAHAAACLAEHGLTGPALALVFDGTGYGPDGTIWGGELLRCDLAGFERVAHLDPVPLPGGEAAIREPWRIAAAYLERGRAPGAVPGLAEAAAPVLRRERAAARRGWAGCSTPSRRCWGCASG